MTAEEVEAGTSCLLFDVSLGEVEFRSSLCYFRHIAEAGNADRR